MRISCKNFKVGDYPYMIQCMSLMINILLQVKVNILDEVFCKRETEVGIGRN